MNTILITGGMGFIGTNLAHRLTGEGNNIIIIDNFITAPEPPDPELLKDPHVRIINFDITDPFPSWLLAVLTPVDRIYHLACPTGVENLIPLAERMIATCTVGTIQVAELARKNRAKIVFSSSSEIYGSPREFPQREEYTGNVDPTGERSPYEEGKRIAESILATCVRKYGVQAVIARIFNTYGPRMSLEDSRVIPRFISQLKDGRPMTIRGSGDQSRTFCYVDDLVSGLMLLMEKGRKGGIYNIGSGREISINVLAEELQSISGKRLPLRHIRRPVHDHARRLPDLSRIRSLGWKERIPLDEGLKRTVLWYGY